MEGKLVRSCVIRNQPSRTSFSKTKQHRMTSTERTSSSFASLALFRMPRPVARGRGFLSPTERSVHASRLIAS